MLFMPWTSSGFVPETIHGTQNVPWLPTMEVIKILLDWTAATAWPIVVLVVVIIYRKRLDSLLSGLTGIAERVHKESVEIALGEKFKLIFRESIKKVEERVKEFVPGTPGVDIPLIRGDDAPPPSSVPPPTRDAPLPANFGQNLDALAEIVPRAAMLEAWRELELALERIAIFEGYSIGASIEGERHSGPPGTGRHLSPPLFVRFLFDKKLIDKATLTVFEELRLLRNQASHVPQFQPSVADAKEYVRASLALVNRIEMSIYTRN